MSFPRYPKYKDSGVDWLGEVPEHWEVSAIKHCVATPITDGPHETPNFPDEGVPLVSAEAVSGGRIDFSKIRGFISREDHERYSAKYRPRIGDIYMVKSGATTGVTAIVETDIEFNIWSPLAAIRSKDGVIPKYVLNFLRSRNFQEGVTLNWSFGTQQNIGMGVIENMNIAIPPTGEQEAIAAFLDSETAKIDELVAEQRRLIELLKEKRQAVISHAVTKGLNPNVPLKPSGIEWLGEVPEHWEVEMLSRFTSKIGNGFVGPTRDILVESGVPYIQATHIKKGRVNFDGAYFVTAEWAAWQSKAALEFDDVLVVQTGAGTGDVGLVSKGEVGYRCHALIIVRSIKSRLFGSFLCATFQSQYGRQTLESIQTGGMHPHLNCGNLKFVYVPVPPVNEQVEIVRFVNEQSEQFETLETETVRAIELLQERRTALISAAVTGKIDVREFASVEAA